MSKSEVEQVLRNWIEQALSPVGWLPDGVDPAGWVAENFVAWWRARAQDSLGSAELAPGRLREELSRRLADLSDAVARVDTSVKRLGRSPPGLWDRTVTGPLESR